MGSAIQAGMTLDDFYKAELWEVLVIIDYHFKVKNEEFQTQWEIARFQMSAMTKTDSIKFPWERNDLKTSKDEWNTHLERMERWKNKEAYGRAK